MRKIITSAFILPLLSVSAGFAEDMRLNEDLVRDQARAREMRTEEQRRSIPGGARFSLPGRTVFPDSSCFTVKQLKFKDAYKLSPNHKKVLKKQWQGRCIDLNDMNKILRSVTDWYVQKGYVTTRAFIEPQDISRGQFEILVVEGRIENYVLQKDVGLKRRQVYGAFPPQPGSYLHIRGLEQGVDQMNKAPSKNVSIQMIPGETRGGTIVGINNQPSKNWSLGYNISNDGGEESGDLMHRFNGGVDNIFGFNDVWRFGFDYSNRQGFWDAWDAFDNDIPDYYYKPDEPKGTSRKYWMSFAVPFRNWSLGFDASRYEYVNEMLSPAESFETSGRSYSLSLGIDRSLYRDQLSKTWLETDISIRDSESFVEDTLVSVNDRRTTTGTIALNHNRTIWKGVFNGRFAYIRGLDWLDATGNIAIAGDYSDINYNFDKISLDLDYMRPFTVKGQQLVFTTHLYGQYSEDILPGADQIGIGGMYSVRGFDDAGLGGDMGFYLRNELTWHSNPNMYRFISPYAGRLSPWIGFDMGSVWNNSDDNDKEGWLAGGALGVKGQGGQIGKTYLNWDITASYPLYSPQQVAEHNDVRFNFNMGISY